MSEWKLAKTVSKYGWRHHFFTRTEVYKIDPAVQKRAPATSDTRTLDEIMDNMIEEWAAERGKNKVTD